MAPSTTPRPNVRYRIQNVDYGTFLERRFDTKLFMRAMKVSLQQQWFFREISDNAFEIRNAQDSEYALVVSSFEDGFTPTCQKVGTAHTPGWKLENSGPNGNISTILYGDSQKNILLHCGNDDSPNLTEYPLLGQKIDVIKEDNYQWRISEVSPTSLPDGEGKYTIQTLKGDVLHPEPAEGGTQRCSVSKEDLEQHHVEINNLGNGKATIKNIRVGAFMNVKRGGSYGDWAPVLSKTTPALQWDIKKIGDFAYMITLIPPEINSIEPRCFALSVENNGVTLKPMSDVHNQLWFIEAVNTGPPNLSESPSHPQSQEDTQCVTSPGPREQPQPNPEPEPQTQVQPRPLLDSQRQPLERPISIAENVIAHGLVEGEYALRSYNGYYMSLDNRGYYITVNTTKPVYFKFELALVPGPSRKKLGKVWISYPDTKTFLTSAQHSDRYHGFTPSLRVKENRDLWEIKVMAPGTPALYSLSYILSDNNQSSSIYARGDASDGSEISVAGYDAYEWMFIPKPTWDNV